MTTWQPMRTAPRLYKKAVHQPVILLTDGVMIWVGYAKLGRNGYREYEDHRGATIRPTMWRHVTAPKKD